MDLNADLGESWYHQRIGNDEALMPLLDSCNVACGFHGGDALTMQKTIDLALRHGVNIGAHPSYPDRKNFGRRVILMPLEALEALLLYQISALRGMLEVAGGTLHHVKLHGALYHFAGGDAAAAKVVVRVVKSLGIPILYGLPGSALAAEAHAAGLDFWPEGFADRRYDNSLHLRPRDKDDALLEDPAAAAEQVRLLARSQLVRAHNGDFYPLSVKTICLHGDHPGAVARARAVREVLGPRKK
ncbi:5-oxoprolinase subunit PxpA [Neolewinella lacunae]|uniref:LamB/YcsF family protein n=1 Tax=Neolewinella lacunae TaxID=1517758 RepID=A0A923PEX4_9BACT|nr:5-oxoprolinase subunit PxpA [Neolewinella lacunae]MBC6992807.1 LamB/YcsF family protein [Neolewinella lacunae]MDN3636104.1 5-oxoprolinase subunit PxpA [Neolewinella lacunae]